MRKPLVVLGVFVASCFILSSIVLAMGKKPPMVSKASGKVTVVNIKDAKHPTVTLKPTQGQAVTLQIDPKKTLIMKNDKVVAAANIRLGDILKADYEIRRDNNVATRLFLETPKAAQPAAKPTATPLKKARR